MCQSKKGLLKLSKNTDSHRFPPPAPGGFQTHLRSLYKEITFRRISPQIKEDGEMRSEQEGEPLENGFHRTSMDDKVLRLMTLKRRKESL